MATLVEISEEERIEVSIAVWPNGTWCFSGDISDYAYMSDDYTIIKPSVINEEDIQDAVCQYLMS